MEALPSVVFVSCTEKHPKQVIESVIQGDERPLEFQDLEEGVSICPWELDNKYYKARIHLCALESVREGGEAPAMTAPEAIVIHFESQAPNAMEEVDKWNKLLKEYEADVKILLCSRVAGAEEEGGEGVARTRVLQWCIKEGYELIETEGVEESEWEDEATGVERLWEALHAHEWPNLLEKGGRGERERPPDDLDPPQDVGEWLDGEPDFSELFSQLVSIKEKAVALSGDERKDFAENIVRAYWKAIGGDDTEFSD